MPDSLPHLNAAVTPETCSVYVAIRLTPHLNVVLERSLVAKLETREDVNPGRVELLPVRMYFPFLARANMLVLLSLLLV